MRRAMSELDLIDQVVLIGVRPCLSVRDLVIHGVGFGVWLVVGAFLLVAVVSILRHWPSTGGMIWWVGSGTIIWMLVGMGELFDAIRATLLLLAKRRICVSINSVVDEMIIGDYVCWERSFELDGIEVSVSRTT